MKFNIEGFPSKADAQQLTNEGLRKRAEAVQARVKAAEERFRKACAKALEVAQQKIRDAASCGHSAACVASSPRYSTDTQIPAIVDNTLLYVQGFMDQLGYRTKRAVQQYADYEKEIQVWAYWD